jgi:hypothetical protein
MQPGRFPPGTDVLSPWGADPFLYPAVVLGVDPATKQAFVVYWDGDSAGVQDGELRPLDLRPGMRVEAIFAGSTQYVPGVITGRYGGVLSLQVANSDQFKWVPFSKCRVPK